MIDKPDFYLDITDDVCPMTFVKTKLLIERMHPGQMCEVRLRGAEPIMNIPRSVRDMGDQVFDLIAESGESPDGIHRIRIVKSG